MVECISTDTLDAHDGWFARLYGETYKDSLAFARRLVGDADADDVAQEVFLRIARYRPTTGEHLDVRFVMAVTRNVGLNFISKRNRDRNTRHLRASEPTLQEQTPNGASLHWAEEELAMLPEAQREAFMLVAMLGLSESQAGLAMHLSRPVVGAKKRCAVEALRERVMKCEPKRAGATLMRLVHRCVSPRCA